MRMCDSAGVRRGAAPDGPAASVLEREDTIGTTKSSSSSSFCSGGGGDGVCVGHHTPSDWC